MPLPAAAAADDALDAALVAAAAAAPAPAAEAAAAACRGTLNHYGLGSRVQNPRHMLYGLDPCYPANALFFVRNNLTKC